ncbi:hypothetical protein BKA62DRAFT_822749 [Auriculariales sp. MPI-PUGE-AT-0066]|nr:hypothetical protein BKA62DRAFT_822749 [Auriculariales sp. MPI-PUGE-AT-0066]
MAAARQRSHSHGSDPDHNWAHTPALTELSKWYDRQENATAPPPMAKSTLVMLVEDFRAAAAFGSLPDLDMVHLSVLVILHDGDVSENSAISLIVSKAEAVLLRFITPIFQLVTEFEKQRLPNAVGPQMQMLAYWSFLLEHSAQLALAPGNINLHLAAYERMLKRSGRENDAPGLRGVPSRSTANNDTAPWPNIYIERLFSFFAGPNTYAAEWSWSDSSISATAEIIDATLKQYRGSGWTPRMGSIMFTLFRKFKPALPDHVRWAGTLLSSLVKIPRGHPPIDKREIDRTHRRTYHWYITQHPTAAIYPG